MIRVLTRTQLLVDALIAVLFGLLSWFVAQRLGTWPDLLTVLGFTLALLSRRLSPGLALAIAWVTAILQMLMHATVPAFADVAALGVLFATAAYGGRLVRWLGLASAGVGAIVATLYIVVFPYLAEYGGGGVDAPSGQDAVRSSLAFLFGLLAAFGLSWTLGQLIRIYARARASRRAQLQAERDIVTEHERNRIARDMHDTVAHSLAVVIAQADGARYIRASDPDAVDAALQTIAGTARDALADVRVLLSQLRHSEGESPQPRLEDVERLLQGFTDSGLKLDRSTSGEPHQLAPGQQMAVYRIIQEALTNALRHGDADSPVRLEIEWAPAGIALTVTSALRAGVPLNSGGHGLVGMRERASLAGGEASAGPAGSNWVVTARLGGHS